MHSIHHACMPILSSIATVGSGTLNGERRKEPRVAMDVQARLKCLNPLTSTGPSIKARVVEISRSGMKILANREFHLGGVVQVIVKDTFYMGTVRHCRQVEGGFETGLKLTESIRSSML